MRHGDLAANRRNVNDASPTPRAYVRNYLRNQFVGRPKMKLHRAFEILPRHVLKRTNFYNPRVVDQNVDFAKAINDLTNSGSSLRGIEQVALNGQNRAAARSEIRLCTRQFF